MKTSVLNEMIPLRPLESKPPTEGTIEVSLIIPAKNSADTLEETVAEAHRFLSERFKNSFEIILVPNPSPQEQKNQKDRSTEVAEELSRRFQSVRVVPHVSPRGKGAAVRTGFQQARGRWIFLTDSDLPYDLDFFDQAMFKLKQGYDLVTGNRRLPTSHFSIPVSLLKIAYGRHRLGLGFNRLVRWLLPIQTRDTQAGIKALSRRLAMEVFSRQICPGFLFDLEIFLTAQGHGYWQADLPVTLYLNSEKSTVRILRECLLVTNWLTRITWKNFKGYYGHRQKTPRKILTRYREATLGTRFFLSVRWRLTPYSQMAAHLPPQGTILDLGCGHGLFSLAAAMNSPSRQVIGIDHDAARVTLGSHAVHDLPNIQFKSGNMTQPPAGLKPYSGIAMIDVMHYFDHETQENLLNRAYHLLDSNGTLIVREVNPNGGLASTWNRLYEKIATGIGFTQAEKKGLYFRTPGEWEKVIQKQGFQVHSKPCSSILFADILYVCQKSLEPSSQ